MAPVSAADLRAALDFVAEAHAFEDVDAFRTGILPGLERLVPCDLVGYNEVEPGGGPALVITHPEPMLDFAGEALARLAHQHPLISAQMNGDSRTYKISDFLSQGQFRALALYNELYGRIGAEDQIAFGLPGPVVIGIAMNRDRRSFGERDRELLDLLRPHLAQAHARILERGRTAALLAALERGLSWRDSALLVLDRGGGVAYASPEALELLLAYFPGTSPGAVPAEVSEWLAATPDPALATPAPLTAESARGRLELRLEAAADGEAVLVLEEAPTPDPKRLRDLGLTRRQAEILSLLAAGHGVAEIADALYLSRATVRKHLEHIYARLGVHSRAEAVAAALRRGEVAETCE